MSICQAIKNAFVPWNLIRRGGAPNHEGVRTVDYGQLPIDGTTGDISDMARVIERAERGPSPAGEDIDAIADFLNLPEDQHLQRFDELGKMLHGEAPRSRR